MTTIAKLPISDELHAVTQTGVTALTPCLCAPAAAAAAAAYKSVVITAGITRLPSSALKLLCNQRRATDLGHV